MGDERRVKIEILENLTLEKLNLHDLRGFDAINSGLKTSRTSDYLINARAKADEILRRIDRNPYKKAAIKDTSANKENDPSLDLTVLNHTDYEPYRLPNSINVSDMIVDTTININKESQSKAASISFEPSEMTGRSTHNHSDLQKHKKIEKLSIDDILSTSIDPKVRNLRESIDSSINYNRTLSLPRTADMSKISSNNAETSFGCAIVNSFGIDNDYSDLLSEDFAPGALMESKLIDGEISWAEKCAAIPTAFLSKGAKKKVMSVGKMNSDFRETSLGSNSMFAGEENMSLGMYFNDRLGNISDILPNKYPTKQYTIKPLLDDSQLTPKVDGKTYTKIESSTKCHESKDSGNASENSTILSLSAINRALANLDLESDDASSEQFLKYANKQKTPPAHTKLLKLSPQQKADRDTENKENLDPKIDQLSDTLSFTDSILNSSDFRRIESRCTQSPPKDSCPNIMITESINNEADVDEWPSPPGILDGGRIKRKKSPKDRNINSNYAAAEVKSCSPDTTTTPTNKSSRFHMIKNITMKDNISPNSGYCSQRSNSPSVTLNISPASSPSGKTSPYASSPALCLHRSASPKSPNPNHRYPTGAGIALKGDVGNNHGVASGTSTEKLDALRSTSPYSSCSEFSHRDGKIAPIHVSALSLSWGCVKLRKASYKSIQVKNTSNKRLVLRAEVHGPGFQIVTTQNKSIITLHSQECRTITINFCPTITGIAVGELLLCAPHNSLSNNAPYLSAPLYAFGGDAKIKILEAIRAPDNSLFLPMGNVSELTRPLKQSFRLFNKGPLLGFALILARNNSLGILPDVDLIDIQPRSVLIEPDSSAIIDVVFNPRREYMKKVQKKANSVQVLSTLSIVFGSEVNRQRLRRIIHEMDPKKREKVLSVGQITMNELCGIFPNEMEFDELKALKDNVENLNEFTALIDTVDIALTLDIDELSETVASTSFSFRECDETVIFRSPHIHCQGDDEKFCEQYGENEGAVSSTQERSWSVYPNCLHFDICGKRRRNPVSFFVRNYYKSRQYFEITCNVKNLLCITPNDGYVEPDGGQTEIYVRSINKVLPAEMPTSGVEINVRIENERITIPVKLLNDSNH